MKLRNLLAVIILALLVGLAVNAARAEEVIEAWRSPFGAVNPHHQRAARSTSVNPSDGSCWVVGGRSVMHLAADGTILRQINVRNLAGFDASVSSDPWPASVSVNPTDGSCWVAESVEGGHVLHLAEDGTELWRGDFGYPYSVSVNPTDGSCWVADAGPNEVVHLSADGAVLWRGGDFNLPSVVSVNPMDGSCWVADGPNYAGKVVHLAQDGTELWRGERGETVTCVSVNPTDGSCWVSERYPGAVLHLAADGAKLWRGTDFVEPGSVSVNPTDGSCWVANGVAKEVVHLAEDGTEIWRGSLAGGDVSVDPIDGSCWVRADNSVVHLAEDGTELWQGRSPLTDRATAVSLNPSDGSCWVAQDSTEGVVHLAADGAKLWQGAGFNNVQAVCVNPTDGSCWVLDLWVGGLESHDLVHLAEDGTELWRGGDFGHPVAVSVNPSDGSCWVADTSGSVVHVAQDGTELWRGLAADGAELWRGGGLGHPWSVSVNPTDGSCWAADRGYWDDALHDYVGSAVVHLATDGTELQRLSGFLEASLVAVNSADGSCWVAEYQSSQIAHLAADGAELWRGGGFSPYLGGSGRTPISVNPTDGSCWVADFWTDQVVRLAIWFDDVPTSHWAFREVRACSDAGVVGGYPDGLYHPEREVSRGQMAVFVARGLAGGDAGVPDFTGTPTFPDVGTEHWALDYVEYVVGENVVGGYEDGTYQPDWLVNRGQMSVYVARSMVAPTTSVLADYVPADPRNFPDVTTDHWAYTYVEYCVEQGVVGGFLDGTYRPDTVVTRDQMAVYVSRTFGLVM